MARRRGRPRRRSATQRQVDLEAGVRFGPQKRALRDLLEEAYEALRTTAATEEGAARGIRAAVNAAKPQVTKIYGNAFSTQDQANADVNRDLSMLSAAADPFRAVSAREAGGAKRRLAESLAGASKELVDREVQAEQGRAYAITNATQRFRGDVKNIARQQSGLAKDIGAFKSATYGSLKEAQAEAEREAAKERRDYELRVAELGLSERRTAATERNAATTERNSLRPRGGGRGGAKGPRSARGYGRTNVSQAVAVTNRGKWEGILAYPKNAEKPPSGNALMLKAAAQYHHGKGKVPRATALKIWRTFGFRIPYSKPPRPGRTGRPISKNAPKSLW